MNQITMSQLEWRYCKIKIFLLGLLLVEFPVLLQNDDIVIPEYINVFCLGPVFVEFPIDTLYPYELVKREIGMKDKGPVSLVQRIINWYVR
jgi:hypothetical protein